MALSLSWALAASAHAGPVVTQVAFKGNLTHDTVSAFIQRVGSYRSVRTMVIMSGGGDSEAGIALGHFLRQRGWTLAVQGYCLSACASYVFAQAREKVVLPGAIVGIHASGEEMASRRRYLGPEPASDCPPRRIWALSRAQLESEGVKGIGDFWFPSDAADWHRVAQVAQRSGLATRTATGC